LFFSKKLQFWHNFCIIFLKENKKNICQVLLNIEFGFKVVVVVIFVRYQKIRNKIKKKLISEEGE